MMPLTHDFKETIRARAQRDLKFRRALLREAVERQRHGGIFEPRKAYANSRQEPDAYAGTKGQPLRRESSSVLTALQKTKGVVRFEPSLRR